MVTDLETNSVARPRRFTITYLLLFTLLVAVSLALAVHWGMSGAFVALFLFPLGLSLLNGWHVTAACVLMLSVLAALLSPGINRSTLPSSPRNQCISYMRQLAVAINNYESVNGHFPPAYTVDENGRRLHSWRVLLLPYLEERELFEKFDLSKPWDHPGNLRYAAPMPPAYRCPGDTSSSSSVTTTYVAVVGEDTMWPGPRGRTAVEVSDGLSKTIMLVDSSSARVHWMAPSDVDFSSIAPVTEDGRTLLLVSNHRGGSVCAFCDAKVTFVPNGIPFEDLKAALTADRGERVDSDLW